MPRGGRRSGAGRKPGSKLTRTAQIAHGLAQDGVTPLEFVLNVMRDETQPLAMRVDCAKAALPHVHPRLASITQTVRNPDMLKSFLDEVLAEKARQQSLPVIDHVAYLEIDAALSSLYSEP